MTPANIVVWLIGVGLIAVGYARARGPWSRYRALREQQANIDRYEAWRGGLRSTEDGPTGASVMMAETRRQAQSGGVLIAIGIVLVVVGFVIR